MSEEFPLWVREEAARRANEAREREHRSFSAESVISFPTGRAICRLIQETQEPPVDPLLEEVRRAASNAVSDHLIGVSREWWDAFIAEFAKRGLKIVSDE